MDNYEEKYKSALKWMQSLYGGLHGVTKEEAEHYFPELKESEDEKMRESIIYALRNGGFYSSDKTDEAIAWLEKQGKQPTDKVEPKFHEGDWIVINEITYQITEIDNSHVVLSLNGRECNFELNILNLNNAHLWSIQDAKNGDILVYKNDDVEWILIYKNIISESCDVPHDVLKYYALFTGNVFYDSGIVAMISENYASCFTPATKEQCDLFFQKMKEAKYEWDPEKKELSKQTSEKFYVGQFI